MITDREGRILRANSALARMVRHPATRLLGKTLAELTGITVDEPWRQRAWEGGKTSKRHGVSLRFAFAPERGTTYWDVVVVPILQPDGRVGSVLTAFTEVSEYVIARQTVEEERAGLRTILEMLPVGVFIVDAAGGIISANAASRRVWGGPIPEVQAIDGYGVFTGWWAHNQAPVQPAEWGAARAIRQGQTILDDEIDIQRFDGTRATILNSATPLRDATGEVNGAIWVLQDISARKQVEEERERALAEMEATLASIADGLVIFAPDSTILRANAAARQLFGIREAEAGRLLRERTVEFTVETLDGAAVPLEAFPTMRALHGETVTGEVFAVRYPDHTVWISATASPIYTPDGEMLGAVLNFADISEIVCLREEAQHRSAELDATLASLADGLIIYSPAGEILLDNPAARRLLDGILIENEYSDLPQWLSRHAYTPDGKRLEPKHEPGARAAHGKTVTGEVLVFRHKDGTEIRVSVSAAPIRQRDGRISGVVSTYTDITRLTALQQQQQILLQTVSHDLRSPLSVIKGYTQLATESLEEASTNETIRQCLTSIDRSVSRMDVMIQDLVDAARWEGGQLELKREAVDLPRYIDDLLQRVSLVLDTARVQVDMPVELPPVSADYARLERILANLLSNALKYSESGTPVWVKATAAER